MSTCYAIDGRSNIARAQRRRLYRFAEPCPAGTAPLASSVAGTDSGTTVTVTFDANVATSDPAHVDVYINGTRKSITGVSPSTNTAVYTIDFTLSSDDVIIVEYDGLGDITLSTDSDYRTPNFSLTATVA